MALTPQQFFERYAKWLLLVFIALFLFKSVQSCNRNMKLTIDSKKYTHEIDSLKTLNQNSLDSIKKLNFELEIASEKAKSANDRAVAVQSAVEKMRTNTTITVKGAEQIKDTTKR
jgi:hypothetical protein